MRQFEQQNQRVAELVRQLTDLRESHPKIDAADLVVEAGVGRRYDLGTAVRGAFPEAVYVGTDLHPYGKRIIGAVDKEEILGQIESGHPLYANCFDTELVASIAEATGRQHPIMVSTGALVPLANIETIGGDRVFSYRQGLDREAPYEAQVHLTPEPFGDYRTRYRQIVDSVISQAEKAGWQVDILESGVVFARPERRQLLPRIKHKFRRGR